MVQQGSTDSATNVGRADHTALKTVESKVSEVAPKRGSPSYGWSSIALTRPQATSIWEYAVSVTGIAIL